MSSTTLQPDQLREYRERGYVVLESVFTEPELEEMRQESDRLAELTVNASIALGELSPRLDVQTRDGKVILRKVQPVNDISEVFSRYSSDDRFLAPMRDILDSQPIVMEEKLNYKQPLPGPPPIEADTSGEGFPYHTDWAYFGLDGYPKETLSSALLVDETTAENGPLRMLPGSHKKDWPIQDEWPPLVREGIVPEGDVVDLLAPAGTVVIFSSALVHASSENRTDGPRRMMIFSHYPSTFEIDHDQRNRPLRERSQEHERRYREWLDSGEVKPSFRMSVH